MNNQNQTFRDELLNAEQPTDALKQKYESQLKGLLEKKLTGATKWAHIGGLMMGVGFAVLFGTLAVTTPKGFSLWGRAIFTLGAVFGLIIIIFEAFLLKKGTIDLKKDEVASAGIGWGFIVIVGAICLVASARLPDPARGAHMLASILVFEVAAAGILLKAYVKQSEISTREKLLDIEYRIAELSEKFSTKPQD